MAALHGKNENIMKLANRLGLPPHWRRFKLDIACDDFVTVECEYAVSAEENAEILTGKFHLETISDD